ncbi:MAG: EI24 domain-containing protein [Pseudomonadota bacterium]
MNIYYGLKYNLKGVLLSIKTPKLLMLGLLRFFVVVWFSFLLSGLVLYFHEQILAMIWKMPDSGWLIYLWKVASWILSLVLAAISMVMAYLISQLFFCVFIMDYMSSITEKIFLGEDAQSDPHSDIRSWFIFFIYLIKQEIPRAIIPVLITLLIMIIGLLTPISPVIIAISSIVAIVFLAWDNTDLTPARRMLPFKVRLRFLKENIGFHIGFGLWFLIPGLNIIFLSFAPVGATLYYLEKTK